MGMDSYYPLLLQMAGRSCLLVGGGRAAQHKARAMWESTDRLYVVSPELTGRLREAAAAGHFEWIQREYETKDMNNKDLVITATGIRAVDEAVLSDARRCGVLAASATDPDQGDFIVPASMRRGRLMMTVSTAGASPLLAARIRGELEGQYDADYEGYLEVLHGFREQVKQRIQDAADRRVLLEAVLQLNWRKLLAEGRLRKACDQLLEEWEGTTR